LVELAWQVAKVTGDDKQPPTKGKSWAEMRDTTIISRVASLLVAGLYAGLTFWGVFPSNAIAVIPTAMFLGLPLIWFPDFVAGWEGFIGRAGGKKGTAPGGQWHHAIREMHPEPFSLRPSYGRTQRPCRPESRLISRSSTSTGIAHEGGAIHRVCGIC